MEENKEIKNENNLAKNNKMIKGLPYNEYYRRLAESRRRAAGVEINGNHKLKWKKLGKEIITQILTDNENDKSITEIQNNLKNVQLNKYQIRKIISEKQEVEKYYNIKIITENTIKKEQERKKNREDIINKIHKEKLKKLWEGINWEIRKKNKEDTINKIDKID